MKLCDETFDELNVRVWHDIVKLRVDVFVVEQRCDYAELDGRDVEDGTRHIWLGQNDEGIRVAAYLRLLEEPVGQRIGRVVTRPASRGQGLAGQLMRYALEHSAGPWVLDAQVQLQQWYADFGFVAEGDVFLEDGIEHVVMRRGVG